ncbi:hypothetical protein MMC24_003271 [Lignoscripta atroalba]|nr:hypothetical protein [Lignoscripta atroalba]
MAFIVLTTCNNSATDDHSTVYKPDVILIDEVGQAAEIDVLIPLAMYPDAQRIVLVGDHKQLASVVPSEKGNEFAEQRSYSAFERFLDLGYQAELLSKSYRSTANINASLAEHYYQDLKQCAPPVWDKIVDAVRQWAVHKYEVDSECLFIDVSNGIEETEEGSTSKFNVAEAKVIVQTIDSLLRSKSIEPEHIAIIVTYKQQRLKILELLESYFSKGDIARFAVADLVTHHSQSDRAQGVDLPTIDAFQGREREIVISNFVAT